MKNKKQTPLRLDMKTYINRSLQLFGIVFLMVAYHHSILTVRSFPNPVGFIFVVINVVGAVMLYVAIPSLKRNKE